MITPDQEATLRRLVADSFLASRNGDAARTELMYAARQHIEALLDELTRVRREVSVKCGHCQTYQPQRLARKQKSGVWLCCDHVTCQDRAAVERVMDERAELEEELSVVRGQLAESSKAVQQYKEILRTTEYESG